MLDDSKHRLFVYGTLLRDQPQHRLIAAQTFLCKAKTQPAFRMMLIRDQPFSYPALVRLPRPELHATPISILGEVYEVDDACLAKLDAYEGVSQGLYLRQTIALVDQDRPAIGYVYQLSVAGCVDCGPSWSEFIQQRQD